jgi:hypothetical protein
MGVGALEGPGVLAFVGSVLGVEFPAAVLVARVRALKALAGGVEELGRAVLG